MKSYEVDITIDEHGVVTVEVKGMNGRGCADISAIFDELGIVTNDQPTMEYFQQEQNQGFVLKIGME